MSFKLTDQQMHAIIILILFIVSIILVILVVKASKNENFRHRGVGVIDGLAARIKTREGFTTYSPSTGGTFNMSYNPSHIETREGFSSGMTNKGAVGLKAEGFSPMIDAKSVKSHLRTKQRIIY
jgi:hypothetical protein